MLTLAKRVTRLFPVLVIVFSALAFWQPAVILSLNLGAYVSWLLGLVMLGMGLTMSPNDFKMVFTRPGVIFLGVAMRCLLMPLIAFSLAHLLHLPDAVAVGLILVGCCPSGTASNVMTFIAKGDTALSVTLTSIITVLSPILTPISFYFLAGSYIHVDVWGMFESILIVVILPVVVGVTLHVSMKQLVERMVPFVPVISIIAIVIIIMAVVAGNANKLASVAFIAFIAVMLHNALGLTFGYVLSRVFKQSVARSRAIAFEIGMENSGLAVVLVAASGLNPMAAIPGAIFSVWHNLSGSLLASYWGSKPLHKKNDEV